MGWWLHYLAGCHICLEWASWQSESCNLSLFDSFVCQWHWLFTWCSAKCAATYGHSGDSQSARLYDWAARSHQMKPRLDNAPGSAGMVGTAETETAESYGAAARRCHCWHLHCRPAKPRCGCREGGGFHENDAVCQCGSLPAYLEWSQKICNEELGWPNVIDTSRCYRSKQRHGHTWYRAHKCRWQFLLRTCQAVHVI